MKNYRSLNNLFGWIAFLISAVVYIMTTESSASFWDCSEFILSAHKLEVGHPPGAPFFMLMANLFSQFASEATMVGKMINIFSALCSATTILFLFWTITHLTKKIVLKNEGTPSLSQGIAILGSGMVGALAYTFSDTFWFSAVEGEVYACSSLFTALVFWVILKWEEQADLPHSDRWIVLIAYLMGLSIGVHLLNLLAIPAIVLVYYYKRYEATWKGTLGAIMVSFALIILLMYGLIPGMVRVASWSELLFVNSLSMPFNTGVFVYAVLLIATTLWGVYESAKGTNRMRINISFLISTALMGVLFIGSGIVLGILLLSALGIYLFTAKSLNNRLLNTTLLSLMVMAIGYSSYAIIMIRSTANTPMDQNSPEDVFTLERYLNREQYGDRPLIYGQTFAAEVQRASENGACIMQFKQGSPIYTKKLKTSPEDKDEYIISGYKEEPIYQKELCMLFPRMHNPKFADEYKSWSNFKGKPVTVHQCGEEPRTVMKPTFMENIRFFLRYQLGHMYFRYFLWNFSGRQNDIQGYGEIDKGNAITGINFIDKFFVGDQSLLPDVLKNNKGRNVFYMLPLILGLIGLFYQAGSGKKGEQSFLITLMLFFMTGIAIVIYLNQSPHEPRERDYAYAGSFYAFCIWIGMGTYALYHWLSKYLKEKSASIAAVVLTLIVPIQMASQTWDDHDRSGRTVCPDFGYNYLVSCDPNAIIFTFGDNDTFPLWYLQEVEGVRTDVRICNLSYLQVDWYIDQMKRQAYDSDPLPISWTKDKYVSNKRDIIYLIDMIKDSIDINMAFDYVLQDDPKYKKLPRYSGELDYIPSHKMYMPINGEELIRKGIVEAKDSSRLLKQLNFNFSGKSALLKHESMVLEMIRQSNFERPIYFAISTPNESRMRLDNYLEQTGHAYKLVPFKQKPLSINTEKMYDNLMHHYRFGGIEKPGIYLDENVMNMAQNLRSTYGTLAQALVDKGQKAKALEVLDYCEQHVPEYNVPHSVQSILMSEVYFAAGNKEKAAYILDKVLSSNIQKLNWYAKGVSNSQRKSAQRDIRFQLSVLNTGIDILNNYMPEKAKTYMTLLEDFYRKTVN